MTFGNNSVTCHTKDLTRDTNNNNNFFKIN